MIPEYIKRASLLFFSLIAAILIIEGLMRIAAWTYVYLQEQKNKVPIVSTSSQLNLTNREKIVVLCIGESTTAGTTFETWPSQLQRILNTTQEQTIFHVINKGVPGVSTSYLLREFEDHLDQYNPDIVLAMIGVNDGADMLVPDVYDARDLSFIQSAIENSRSQEANREKNWQSPPRLITILNHFRVYKLFEWITDSMKTRAKRKTSDNLVGRAGDNHELVTYGLYRTSKWINNITNMYPKTIQNINTMVSLATDRGINFIFVQYPRRKAEILKRFIERDMLVISNYKIFEDLLKQYEYDDLFADKFAGDFGHTTVLGSRVIADNVARQLKKFLGFKNQIP